MEDLVIALSNATSLCKQATGNAFNNAILKDQDTEDVLFSQWEL